VQQPIRTPIRLYNLENDLGESTDLASMHPDLVEKAERVMDQAYTPSDTWKFPERGE
jgi:uncharacterized sulfatase